MKASASPTDRDFVNHWRRVGPELRRIRLQELSNFEYDKNWRIIDSLLEIACDRAIPRTTSGLVELQRLLAKARR